MSNRLNNAINEVERQLKTSKSAEIYTHPLSRFPLNDGERIELFNTYRQKGYNIWPKINSHGIKYHRIS